MTRKSLFSILILVAGLLISSVAFATKHKSSREPEPQVQTKSTNLQTVPGTKGTATPAPIEVPEKKMREPKTEELVHIHHFHKERVRKLKRHHKKFWILSKILLVICHLLILALAFIHLTH